MANQDADRRPDVAEGDLFDPDALIGVHVVRDADPATRARELAEELNGEIVTDLDHAERAFAARAEAGRVEPVVLTDAERADLVAQTEAADADRSGPVTDAMVVELRQLAEELQVTERIRTETEGQFTDSLNRRLSGGTGVAVHPDAIRQAARAVTDAEDELAANARELAELEETEVDRTIGGRTARHTRGRHRDRDLPAAFDDRGLEQRRRGRVIALLIALAGAVAAAVLLVIGVAWFVPLTVVAVAIVVAAVLVLRARRRVRDRDVDASAVPASVTEERGDGNAEPDGPRPPMTDAQRRVRRTRLESTREQAEERLRSALRHWESLVGAGTDPHDVDAAVRAHDPQFELAGVASRTSPTVRTVSAVHRRSRARWRVAWAAVGYERPPALVDAPAHLERLAARGSKAGLEARERLHAADAWAEACATIDRVILLVNPEGWLPPGRLASMVNSLPAGAEVIIVTR